MIKCDGVRKPIENVLLLEKCQDQAADTNSGLEKIYLYDLRTDEGRKYDRLDIFPVARIFHCNKESCLRNVLSSYSCHE